MADRVMLVTWGESIAGREAHGLEVFSEAIGLYGRLQPAGAALRDVLEACLRGCSPEGSNPALSALTGQRRTAMRKVFVERWRIFLVVGR